MINGKVARLGDKADPNEDQILVDGRKLVFEDRIYIKLYKPRGVISSVEDEHELGRETVRDLVDVPEFIYPVGRLDKQSEGLMLLTNDGQLTHKMTHPKFEHHKIYHVRVEGHLSDEAMETWRRGLLLDGSPTAPAGVELIERRKNSTLLRVTLREGRKRQIRRVAASLGYPVTRLIRMQIGPLQLGELEPGQWSVLSEGEVSALRKAANLR